VGQNAALQVLVKGGLDVEGDVSGEIIVLPCAGQIGLQMLADADQRGGVFVCSSASCQDYSRGWRRMGVFSINSSGRSNKQLTKSGNLTFTPAWGLVVRYLLPVSPTLRPEDAELGDFA